MAHRCISIYAIDPWSSMRFHNSHGRSMHPDTTIQTSGFSKPSLGRVCSRGVCWTSMEHLCFLLKVLHNTHTHTHQAHPDRMRVGIKHQLFEYWWDRKCYGTTTGFELHLTGDFMMWSCGVEIKHNSQNVCIWLLLVFCYEYIYIYSLYSIVYRYIHIFIYIFTYLYIYIYFHIYIHICIFHIYIYISNRMFIDANIWLYCI